ncbi:hypothetical protein GCM10009831_35480 [Dietzia cercidiphylli]|uniref:Uncharacterized protein n=1 Tax=Dietzia cercidiphylli TaxID=498199 RepID=A0ABP4VF30_9ACTN
MSDVDVVTPPPGSKEARAKGCPCPQQDHRHAPDWPWWIDPRCPVHGWKEFQ